MDEKVNNLKNRYCEIFEDKANRKANRLDDWAVKKRGTSDLVYPTIPFVGKNYFEETHKKVLVYASAENLASYCKGKSFEHIDDEEYVWNRHRHRNKFDETKKDFFPDIHIEPMSDGSLATAVLYICIKLGMDIPDDITPDEFYEMIAIANYCKFSIKGEKNIDYAYDKNKLKCSEEYVKADLDVLKPDYIILPKTIYYNSFKSFICDYAKDIMCIPIMQINPTTINCHINKKYERRGPQDPVKK